MINFINRLNHSRLVANVIPEVIRLAQNSAVYAPFDDTMNMVERTLSAAKGLVWYE